MCSAVQRARRAQRGRGALVFTALIRPGTSGTSCKSAGNLSRNVIHLYNPVKDWNDCAHSHAGPTRLGTPPVTKAAFVSATRRRARSPLNRRRPARCRPPRAGPAWGEGSPWAARPLPARADPAWDGRLYAELLAHPKPRSWARSGSPPSGRQPIGCRIRFRSRRVSGSLERARSRSEKPSQTAPAATRTAASVQPSAVVDRPTYFRPEAKMTHVMNGLMLLVRCAAGAAAVTDQRQPPPGASR